MQLLASSATSSVFPLSFLILRLENTGKLFCRMSFHLFIVFSWLEWAYENKDLFLIVSIIVIATQFYLWLDLFHQFGRILGIYLFKYCLSSTFPLWKSTENCGSYSMHHPCSFLYFQSFFSLLLQSIFCRPRLQVFNPLFSWT